MLHGLPHLVTHPKDILRHIPKARETYENCVIFYFVFEYTYIYSCHIFCTLAGGTKSHRNVQLDHLPYTAIYVSYSLLFNSFNMMIATHCHESPPRKVIECITLIDIQLITSIM